MNAEQRLWWNTSRTRLVAEDDEAATYLAYPVGHPILAEHQHLVPTDDPAPDNDPEQPDTKPAERVPNKQRRPQTRK